MNSDVPKILLTGDWFMKYAAGLAGGLARVGARPVLLTRDHGLEFGGDRAAMAAHVTELAPSVPLWMLERRVSDVRSLPAIRRMVGLRRGFRPDIVHFQEAVEDDPRLLAIAGARRGAYAYTVHDPVIHPGDSRPPRHAQVLRRRLLRRAGVVFVHAASLADELREAEDVPGPIEVVPHGAETHIPAPMPAQPGILFFGRMSEYKGLDVLLDALPAIRSAVPGVRLIVAGDGPLPDHPGLADGVDVRHGHVPENEVPGLFAAATLVALPYVQASQSGVGSLAKSYGRAMVVTEVGGLPELVADGSGTIVPPRDAVALAEAIIALLSDPDRAQELGLVGARSAAGQAGWATVAEMTLAAYERHGLL